MPRCHGRVQTLNGPLQEGAFKTKTPHRSPSTDALLDAGACDAAALDELMDAFLQISADRTPHLARASRGGNGSLRVLVHTMFASKLRHFEHDYAISAALPHHVPVVARLIQATVSFKIAPDAAAAVDTVASVGQYRCPRLPRPERAPPRRCARRRPPLALGGDGAPRR